MKAMDEIDPPVKLDDPANEASKQYLLSLNPSHDFDYPQVSLSDIKILSFRILFSEIS